MPGEHSSYGVGLTPLPRFRAGQDGRLPRTYLQVRGTTTFHAAATSSGSPRTPLGSTRGRARGSTKLRGKRATTVRRPRCGVFLVEKPARSGLNRRAQNAEVLLSRPIPRARSSALHVGSEVPRIFPSRQSVCGRSWNSVVILNVCAG